METTASLSAAQLRACRAAYESNPVSRVATRAASKHSVEDICYNTASAAKMNHKFSVEVPTLPATNQKASGRCWIFASLNLLREKIARDLHLDAFELSQNYISFYDHLEKANTFLENILDTAADPLDDRYLCRLLTMPVGDGGWWEYFVGLCNKYGVVPKEAMPETYQSEHSEDMNLLLNMQLRRDARELRKAAAAGADRETLRTEKGRMLCRVYNLLAICLGNPPEQFDFEYVDKDGTYHADRGLQPQAFYAKYIGRNLDNIVSILNAPTDTVPYYKTYYTKGEESLCGCYQAKRLNLPMDEFKAAVIRQLQDGDLVWFVCDCDYYGNRKEGVWDTDLYNYEEAFGLTLDMDKGDRKSVV